MNIKGGYYIKARKIQDSEIAHSAPCIREIWDWILKEANHQDTRICNRGECVRSYKDIQNGLAWYIGWRKMTYTKHDCENTMKWLRKHTMVTTKKTTRGIIITVLNYDYYQNPKNYENHKENTTRTTTKPQTTDTINKNDKNVKNDKKGEELSPSKKMKEFIKRYNEKKDFMDLLGDYWNEKVSTLDETQLKFFLDEVNKFCFYWIELNKSGTRQKWEMQKTFQVERRLVTWFNNIKKFSNNKTNNIQII